MTINKLVREIHTSDIGYTGTTALYKCELAYTVSGMGRFPLDMLRYDEARIAPNYEQFVDMRDGRSIAIVGNRCTPERWRSFGWTVHPIVREYRLLETQQ